MLTVMEAIEKRRSVRKFKPDPVPDELISQMLEAARLAPSARNRQPWRFQIITDPALRERIFTEATPGTTKYVLEAPVMIVCGSELFTFAKGRRPVSPFAEYLRGDKEEMDSEDWERIKQFMPDAHFNTGLAVEHMVLMGIALGLGTCWIQTIKYREVARILGWPQHIAVVTLLLVGYPDGDSPPRPRLPLEEIILREGQLPP